MDIIALISRWIHLFAVIAGVGGAIFARVALMPALKTLDESQRNELHEVIRKRWLRVVHPAVALILISGLYNYVAVTRPLHVGQSLYHALFGVKFLLALFVFFVASALVGRSKGTDGMRAARGKWLGMLILAAAIIVAISGFLKQMPTTTKPAVEATMRLPQQWPSQQSDVSSAPIRILRANA